MFFQFFFMGWKTDFTVLGFFFTVIFTENTQFQLSLNKVPFSTCKEFPHEIIFPCLKCFLFVIHLHLSWTLASPRKLGQQRSTWGANGSLRKKHFTARKNDFILETLLPLRKVTLPMSEVSMYRKATCRCNKSIWRKASSSFTVVFRRNLDRQSHQIPQGLVNECTKVAFSLLDGKSIS